MQRYEGRIIRHKRSFASLNTYGFLKIEKNLGKEVKNINQYNIFYIKNGACKKI
jgi:hypothetical protein